MSDLYVNRNQYTYSHELWETVKNEPPKEVYLNQDYVMVFATAKGKLHPQSYVELHAPDVIQGIKDDRAQINYSTEEKVEALQAMQFMQKGLHKKCETVADQIRLFISKIMNYVNTHEWVDDVTLEERMYEKAIQDLSKEIDGDIRQANTELKVKRLKETLSAAVPAKIAREQGKRATLARIIQGQVQGNRARQAYQKAQAALEKEKSVVVVVQESPPTTPHKQQSPLPVLVFSDDQIEKAPQHYTYDKSNPIEAGEHLMRRKGELVGKRGRCIRQLFRSLGKGVQVVSLTGVPNAFNDYCLTLKQSVVGTLQGTPYKIKLPSKIYFEINTRDKQKVIHFKNNFDFPDIAIEGDSVKIASNKVEKPYQAVCALLEKIAWKA